jgi:hypothetical protein
MFAAEGRSPHALRRLGRSVPNAFPAGMGTIPNNPLLAAAIAAIFKGGPRARDLFGGWERDAEGRLAYRHIGKRGGQILVHMDGGPGADWAAIEGLGALTADVALAVLAQLCEPGMGHKSRYPSLLAVPVSANAILRYKGVRRWGTERAVLQARIAEEMERLGRLAFTIESFPAFDPAQSRWSHRGVSATGERLFAAAPAPEGAGEAVWLVRLGGWSRWWMNTQGKVWPGPLPHALLELDHRANRGSAVLAKKIGIATMVLWGAARSRDRLERRIDHLLESIGELPRPEARDGHWAGRLRDRFDDALLMLMEEGVFEQIDWPAAFPPGAADRARGWAEPWLAARLTFHRPACMR